MNMFVKHSRYIRLTTLMIPFFLVFMGMRVPDFSRPHKPKPMRRAVLDKPLVQTVLQSVGKIDADPFLTSPHTFVFLATEEYSTEVHPISSPSHFLSLSLFPPRAPPVVPSLA